MVSIGPLSPSPVSPHASSTTAFKPAVPTPPQAPTQTPTGTGTTGTGPLAPHFNGSRNDAVAAMTDRAHTALFGNLGQQALAAVTRGPDFSADHALTALRFENRDAFAEMAERHDHAGQRRIAGEVAEVLVQTFTRDGISGVFGYHMMSRGQQDSLLAHAMAAARDEDQIIRSEDRGGYMPASTRNPHTASPQTPERDPFEHAVPDLGPTTGGSENPLGISPQNTRPVEFREFPDQSPIRETPTPSPEQDAAETELAREALPRETEAGALQNEVGGMRSAQRQVIVEGRARDAIRDEERNLRGGGGLNFEAGPLTDPASIAQLFGNLRERADASRADGRADIADAIMRQLSERYRDFAGQAGGGVQGPDSVRDGSGAGGGLLRELEDASRRTGRPLEELVRERAEELRAAGQGEQALELQRAFAHAYPNLAGPTGGRANAPVESSAELNRIRQTTPEELAGEINGAGDLSGYHEEELKAIMLRLLGAQSGSEDITAALERIGRALPEVTAEMLNELQNRSVQNALTRAVMNGEVLRDIARNFIIANPEGAAIILFDGDKFSDYNNATSFIDGDRAIELMSAAVASAAENLREEFAELGITILPARDGGDEFAVAFIPDGPEAAANLDFAMRLFMNELYAVIQQHNRDNETPIPTLSGAGAVINRDTLEGTRMRAMQEGDDELAGKTDEELINRLYGVLDNVPGHEFKNEDRGEDYYQRGGFVSIDPITGEPNGPPITAPYYPNPDSAVAPSYRWPQGGTPSEDFYNPDVTSQSLPNRTWGDFARPQHLDNTPSLNPDPPPFVIPDSLAAEFDNLTPGNTPIEKLQHLAAADGLEQPFLRLVEEGIRVQNQPAIHEHFAALFDAAEDGTGLTKVYIEPRQMKALNDEAFIELPDGTRMEVGHAGGNEMLDDLWRALHQAMVEFFGADYRDSGAAGGRDRSKRQMLVLPPGTDQQTAQDLMRRAQEIFTGMMPTFTGPDGNDYPIMLPGEGGSPEPFRYNLGYAAAEITKGDYETGPEGYNPAQSRYDVVLSPEETPRDYHGPLPSRSPLEIATGFVDGAITRDAQGNLPLAEQNLMDQINNIPGFRLYTSADQPQ